MDLLPNDYYAKLHSISRDMAGNLELTFTNVETVRFIADTVKVLTKVLNCPSKGRDVSFCPYCGEVLNA